MIPGEPVRNFYRNQGIKSERNRIIEVVIRELKKDGWSDFSLSALIGEIERG